MAAIISSTREGFGWVTKTLCTQNEANAFSLWNNNLGYQGILESPTEPYLEYYNKTQWN
jgi:hypothetical protein